MLLKKLLFQNNTFNQKSIRQFTASIQLFLSLRFTLIFTILEPMKRKSAQSIDYTNWTEEQHIEYLKTHERYLAYYDQHNALSVNRFIKEYASLKHDIFSHIDVYKNAYEKHKMQFLSDADRYIDIILQKKLFNLQCEWRAGLIQLPMVDICADFIFWQHNIRLCPFVPPITPEELDICICFLKEETDYSEALFGEYIDWQNYQGFKNHRLLHQKDKAGKAANDAISEYECAIIPEFYNYFDKAQHTIDFLNTPDKRGEKEQIYLAEGYKIKYNTLKEQLKTENDWEKLLDEKESETSADNRPGLHAFDPMDFIESTEDAETQEAFTYYNHQRRLGHWKEQDDETQMYFDFLKAFDEPIRIEGHEHWRKALEISARRFKQNKIAEMLPYAFDSYTLEFNSETNEDKIIAERVARFKYDEDNHYYKVLKLQKETFLAARQALDGKNDFDYL